MRWEEQSAHPAVSQLVGVRCLGNYRGFSQVFLLRIALSTPVSIPNKEWKKVITDSFYVGWMVHLHLSSINIISWLSLDSFRFNLNDLKCSNTGSMKCQINQKIQTAYNQIIVVMLDESKVRQYAIIPSLSSFSMLCMSNILPTSYPIIFHILLINTFIWTNYCSNMYHQ